MRTRFIVKYNFFVRHDCFNTIIFGPSFAIVTFLERMALSINSPSQYFSGFNVRNSIRYWIKPRCVHKETIFVFSGELISSCSNESFNFNFVIIFAVILFNIQILQTLIYPYFSHVWCQLSIQLIFYKLKKGQEKHSSTAMEVQLSLKLQSSWDHCANLEKSESFAPSRRLFVLLFFQHEQKRSFICDCRFHLIFPYIKLFLRKCQRIPCYFKNNTVLRITSFLEK